MSRFFRAILVSAVATGAAAAALYAIGLVMEPSRPRAAHVARGPEGEVDRLSEEEQQMLLRELGGQL